MSTSSSPSSLPLSAVKMSADIKMWDEEISDAIDWLEDTLEGMNKVKEADRPNKVSGGDM